jgi:sec-independent protein translocase protein TatC
MKKKVITFYLLELRIRSFYIFISLLFSFLTGFYYSFDLIFFLILPISPFLKEFVFITVTETFFTTLLVSLFFTFFFGIPFIFYQFWCFFLPSLTVYEKKEKKLYIYFFFLLFLFGFTITYFFLLPQIFYFLSTFELLGQTFSLLLGPRIYSYIEFTLYCFLSFLFLFQTPLICFFLFKYQVSTPSFFSKYRKLFSLFFLLLSSFLAPPDIVNQTLFFLFFTLLYELSIWVGFLYKKIEKQI